MKDSFRTEIKIKRDENALISHQSNIFLIGSCFSDNIGNMFNHYKFHSLSNPFGVTYNPYSIYRQLERITSKSYFNLEDLITKGEFFNSFELHGSFDHTDKDALIQNLNDKIDISWKHLSQCSHLFITLGTSWVYELKDSHEIVNNCHKFPSSHFSKRMLSIEEIQEACNGIVALARKMSPNIRIVFTVSPVRHLKDGFTENQISKGRLFQSINECINEVNVSYFPSYEIMTDDLRDYRFYDTDMLHPNTLAIEYIWNKLNETYFDSSTLRIMNEVSNIQQVLNHKPFNPKSEAHRTFLKKTKDNINTLIQSEPGLDMKNEMKSLDDQLSE